MMAARRRGPNVLPGYMPAGTKIHAPSPPGGSPATPVAIMRGGGVMVHEAPAGSPAHSSSTPRLPCEVHTLKVDPETIRAAVGMVDGWNLLNPGLVMLRGQLFACIRLQHPRMWIAGGGRGYLLARIAEDFTVAECQPMKGVDQEDLRLFVRGEALGAVGGSGKPGMAPTLAVLELGNDGELAASHIQPASQFEKNWMPCVTSDGRLRLVYRVAPLVVMNYDDDAHTLKPTPAEAAKLAGLAPMKTGDGPRGGSQLAPYEGGYLAVIHERPNDKIHYVHRFVRFDADLTKAQVGPPFIFEHLGIEFCAGLVQHGQTRQWILSFGSEDKAAKLAVVSEETLRAWVPRASGFDALLGQIEYTILSLPGWCTGHKARRLVQLVADDKPQTCVELGVFGGRSWLAIAMGLQHNGSGRIDGIDPMSAEASLEGKNSPANDKWWADLDYEDVLKKALQGRDTLGLQDFATFIRKRSAECVDSYADESIDLLHQDANHSEETSVAEVRAWLPKLKVGGWWICDDTNWSTTQTAQFLLREAGCELLEDHESWRIYRKWLP
jgi:hypothetical protein